MTLAALQVRRLAISRGALNGALCRCECLYRRDTAYATMRCMELTPPSPSPAPSTVRRRPVLRWLFFCFVFCCTGIGFWVYASLTEIRTGHRLWPWSAYAFCGRTTPAALPATVRVGLYEEFSTPWRLAKLQQLTFPVTLAVAAASRTEFLQLRTTILTTYPQVREVYFWPVLSAEEGYYPGAWSSPEGIRHLTTEATDLPLLWDLEVPRGAQQPRDLSLRHWWTNRTTLAGFFARHEQPIHLWRTYASMRLNPAFLRLTALHFDPLEYPTLHLHLDLYTTGTGQDAAELARLARCGVERYGARFIPSLGVLNDGEGPEEIFVPPATLERNLRIVRAAGVSEVWFFGVNGLNPAYLEAIQSTLPLESLPSPEAQHP